MTGPEESYSSTRPISVAELLAKNGTIGAPPVGGRRRRRRGNSEAVTVAELTGEIPIVTDDSDHDTADPTTDQLEEVRDEYQGPYAGNGVAGHVEDEVDEHVDEDDEDGVGEVVDEAPPVEETDAEADYAAHLEERDAEPMFFAPPPRRPQYGLGPKRYPGGSGVGAEGMSPDPVYDLDAADAADLTRPAMPVASAPDTDDDADELPSYLRSSGGSLFGGDSDVDLEHDIDHDLDREDAHDVEHDFEHDLEHDEDYDEDLEAGDESTMSSLARGALVVGQCILAVLFGAGLFIAFDQLWKWNNIVALVLSVLVILGLVVGVRVVRKTEDIGSTLIAVAVGALVTLGPLALLQSG
ncbi:hypothetical protein DVS77_17095 [Mycolicibacterium moriokaense]|nr:hypothetical protein DVS77_17095 [Mycolicibacterium moriokaense]